jgi:hypothetical protein
MMSDNFNFQSLGTDKLKEVIRDYLEIESNNVAVCTNYKNTVTIFNDRLRATATEPVYFIVPNDYKKNENGPGWLYDMSRFKIYKLNNEYLKKKGFDPEFLPDEKTKLPLDEELLIYTSKSGTPKVATEFTLKEQACLYLRVPLSGTPWLDNLIKESIR